MDEKPTNAECVVCKTLIVERSFIPYIPRVSEHMFGSGSENVATEKDREITGYHCPKCGLQYYQLPK